MAFTYDLATNDGKVRLLVTDTDATNPIFQDAEIAAFLSLGGGSTFRGAAQALEVIAASEVLVQKRLKLLDLTTDGPAEAEALRKLAESLRARADEEGGGFTVAEIAETVFQQRERLDKEWMRQSP